jgi:hypothetical protein
MDLASRALALLLLLPFLAAISHADKWQYFYPEYITSISCSVSQAVIMSGRDANEQHEAYIAEAKAERPSLRPDMQHWIAQIDEEPLNRKGRKRAQRACDRWTDEAEDRIKAVAPIRLKPKEKQ